MRMDIPLIVPSLLQQLEQQNRGSTAHINQDTALYTDADIMFYHAFNPCLLPVPEVMALGPESGKHEEGANWGTEDWNTGVLFINLKGLQAAWPSMLQFAKEQKWVFPVFDQSLVNQYYSPQYNRVLDRLPNAYNWKGYWGCSPEVVITHWHGPKPSGEGCIPCYVRSLSHSQPNIADCHCREVYDTLWGMAIAADNARLYTKMYNDYVMHFDTASDASTSLSE